MHKIIVLYGTALEVAPYIRDDVCIVPYRVAPTCGISVGRGFIRAAMFRQIKTERINPFPTMILQVVLAAAGASPRPTVLPQVRPVRLRPVRVTLSVARNARVVERVSDGTTLRVTHTMGMFDGSGCVFAPFYAARHIGRARCNTKQYIPL